MIAEFVRAVVPSVTTLESRQGMGPADDFWYRPTWMGGDSKAATEEEALGLSAWWNGLTLIAGTMGSIPLKLYRKEGESRVEERGDPRHRLMFRRPNRWQTAFEWREMAQGHLLARGNHYSRKIRDRLGRVESVMPLHPARVQPEVQGGEIVYVFNSSRGGRELIPADDMLHLRGLGSNGLTGYSVVALARESLGYALQLERHGSQFMENKGRPGGILSTDQVLKKEQRDQLGQAWDEMFQGGGMGRTAVVDAGLTWQQVGFSNEDAEFLASRQFQVTEIARWLNLPPHLLKDLTRSTNNNIEEQAIEFVRHTMRPWAERWEQRLDQAFLTEEEQESGELGFKFSLEAILRGDSKARGAFYQVLFNMGAITSNEIRAKEEMNPIEGGDRAFVQVNLVPLDQAGDAFALMDESTDRALATPQTRALPAVDDFERRSLRSVANRRRLMVAHRRLFEGAAARIVKREIQDLNRILESVDDGDVDEFLRRVEVFAEGLPPTVRAVMGPVIAAYLELVAQEAAEEAGMDEPPDEAVENFRASYVESMSIGHTNETVGRIRDATEAEGEAFATVRALLARWEENRAAEVALGAVIASGTAVARMVYTMGGLATEWVTSGADTCPYCRSLAGRIVRSADEKFLNKGDEIPGGDGDEPLVMGKSIGHPPAHLGCDCSVRARRL